MNAAIEERVAEFVELRERGEAVSAAAFAARHSDLEPGLSAALARLAAMEALLPSDAAGEDGAPRVVGRYRVLGELGRGGMGRVLRVADPEHPERALALKQVDASIAFHPRALERFRREGDALRGIRHEGVVRVHDSGVHDGRPFLVMELVEGPTLAAVIAQARASGRAGPAFERLELPGEGSPLQRVARLGAQLARALAAVHRSGLRHRDVKPANIVLSPAGRAVLIDFGMVHEESAATLTRTGDLLGTPQYMAPEQARGERADDRSDVYGLAAVLYELLTLEPPHQGPDAVRVLEAVRKRPPRRLRSLEPAVPRALACVVERALAHHHRFRTSNAEALAADLEAFAGGRAVAAQGPGPLERVWRAWTFHRVQLGLGALAVLGALVGWGWYEVQLANAEWNRRGRFDDALRAWLHGDEERAHAEARALVDEGTWLVWPGLLAAIAKGSEPPTTFTASTNAAAEGWTHERAGERAAAWEDYRRAVLADPGAALPAVLAARMALSLRKREEAVREWSSVERLLPDDPVVLLELATALHLNGEYEAALARGRRSLELDPERAPTWLRVAKTLSRLERKEEALRAVERSRALQGGDVDRDTLNAHAVMLSALQRFDEALAVYRTLLERDPSSLQARHNVAMSLDSAHRCGEAEAAYRELYELGGGGVALAALAWMYSGSGKATCCECADLAERMSWLQQDALAEQLALVSIGADKGLEWPVVDTAVSTCVQAGRTERLAEFLEDLLETTPDEDSEGLAHLTVALRRLR